MASRVSATRFVGRTPQLAELEAAWRDALAGQATLAFVAGESGVGKSRLLCVLAQALREEGGLVLWGDCVDLGDDELPYAPVVAALRPLVRADHPALGELPADLAEELSVFLPGRSGGGSGSQAGLFEAVLALLDLLSEHQPVVLVLEDLHWADRATRAFLTFLGRSLERQRLLVVASYRPDELHRRHPLRPLLAELQRGGHARRVDLAPLSEDELAEQLEDILGAPPGPGLTGRLFARSEGNPLHTEELLAAGLDGRGALPPTLRDALMLRIDRLPPDTQDVVRLLGAGQRLTHEVLADAGDLDASRLREALREAVASHIVVADADGAYAFRHALLREVVVDDLLPGDRAHLHLALAGALERRVAAGEDGIYLLAGIAHHFHAAGDQPRALTSSVHAAEAAMRVRAAGTAADLLDRALELWARVPSAVALTGIDEAELFARAAEARLTLGDRVRQEALLRRALSLLDGAVEPERTGILLDRLARAVWAQNRHDEALGIQREAVDLLEDGPPSQGRARVLAGVAKLMMLRSRYAETAAAAQIALEEARAVGDATSESRALNALGVAEMWSGETAAGEATLREAMRVGLEHDLSDETSSAFLNLADALHGTGDSARALDILAEAADVSRVAHEATWRALNTTEIMLELGRVDEAAAALPALARTSSDATRFFFDMCSVYLELQRGEHAAMRARLDRMSDQLDGFLEPQFTAPIATLRAELERREGDLDAARAAVDDGLDRIVTCTDDVARVARIAAGGLAVEADAAGRARDLDRPDEEAFALERARQMLAYVAASAPERPVETMLLARAEADFARARGADDPALWEAAAAAAAALGRRGWEAAAHLEAAEASLLREDRPAAAAAVAAALTVAEPLGQTYVAGEARSLAARGRLALDPSEDAAAHVEVVVEQDPFGLTPRERQVLELVARGATNREIGEQLFMAEKTASVHVSRILAKLGVPNRGQAAAVAHRLGLSPPAPVARA